MEKGWMGRDGEGRDGEGWRGHGVVLSEGGRGSRAHSPELVVAHVLVVACVLIVTHVLIVTRVLVATHVLIATCVRSCALAVIHESRWPFWLVICVCRGLWAMVKGARRWVVVAACGYSMVVGDRSQAVGGRHGWWWL